MALRTNNLQYPESGYDTFVHHLGRPEKDAAFAEVIAQQRKRSFHTYGYRRMWLWLRSMLCSLKSAAAGGNPYNNAMAENFFSIFKTECIYRYKPATFAQANEMINRYIHFDNHERIQLKTGEAPLARRLSA